MTGVPSHYYNKPVLFRRCRIKKVRFCLGSHGAEWETYTNTPAIVQSRAFVLLHYHQFSPEHALARRLLRKFRRADHMGADIDSHVLKTTTLEAMTAAIVALEKSPALCVVPGAAELFHGVAKCPSFSREWAGDTQAVLDQVCDGTLATLAVPDIGDVLEVGVFEGQTTLKLVQTFPEAKVYCVDPWRDANEYGRFLSNVCDIPASRLCIRRGTSDEVLPTLSTCAFKFVCIDGDYSADASWPLLVPGGLLLFSGLGSGPGDIDKWLETRLATGDICVIHRKDQVLVRKMAVVE